MSGGQSAILPFIRSEKPKMVLNPSSRDDSFYFTIAVDDPRNVKEYFYRIKPDVEYRSTGFMPETNPTTGLPYPNLVIPNEKNGLIEIDVKFTDLKSKEHGPYSFKFDSAQLEMSAVKNFVLHDVKNWINVRRSSLGHGVSSGLLWTRVAVDNSFFNNSRIRNAVVKIMYGINKETPDTPFEFLPDMRNKIFDYQRILISEEDNIQYVSAQIFFIDGTSTDIRIFTKQTS